jgi:hypothetical protein
MNRECAEFFENPDADPQHADRCAECRRTMEELDRLDLALQAAAVAAPEPIAPRLERRLPLAPWEGADYRAWGTALLGLLLVVLGGIALFLLAGVSPLTGYGEAVRSAATTPLHWGRLFTEVPELIRVAPVSFHLLIAAVFVTVNLLLFLLLRRPAGGYDAAGR